LVHFGLLRRQGDDRYSLTELGRTVADPLDDELGPALLQAVRNPALYSEIIAKFEPEGRIPNQLATVLERHFGIISQTAGLAARVFFDSAIFAGLLDEGYRFRQSSPCESGKDEQETIRQIPQTDALPTQPVLAPVAKAATNPTQEFRFCLTGNKFALLVVPAELCARDLEILRKQLELLELQTKQEHAQQSP
jgi:hypothetical protein